VDAVEQHQSAQQDQDDLGGQQQGKPTRQKARLCTIGHLRQGIAARQERLEPLGDFFWRSSLGPMASSGGWHSVQSDVGM
jgi:hypothetical protein